MAEIDIGSITARLRIDLSAWSAGLAAARQQLAQLQQQSQQLASSLGAQSFQQAAASMAAFAQSVTAGTAALQRFTAGAQAGTQQTTAQTASTNQLATAYLAMAQAIQGQTQAYAQAQAAALAYRQQQDALRQATQQAAAEASRAGEIFRTAFAVAGGLGLATSLQGLLSSLRAVAVAVVDTGVKLEGLRIGLAALTGGQASGERTFTNLITLSNRLGIDIVKTTESYRGFAGAIRGTVLEGERGDRVFQAVTAASRAMGATSSQTQSALLALEQMISKGTVSMEELRRQLGNALPGAFQIAARAIGVTTQELEKMIRTGTTESIPFVEALARQLRIELGGAAEAASQSVGAAFTRLGNELTLLKDQVAQSGLLALLGSLAETAATLIATIRKANDENQRQQGGAAVTITAQQGALSPAMQARQQQIDILRNQLSGFVGEQPQLLPAGNRDTLMAQLRQLQAEQTTAVTAATARLTAEGAAAGGTGGVYGGVGGGPVESVIDTLVEKIAQGQEALAKLDQKAAQLPGIDVARDKMTAWNKVLSELEVTIGRLSPELAQSLGPRLGAVLAPANALFATLQAEVDLPGDAAKEVANIRQRVAEREREAAQAETAAEREAADRRRQVMATGAEAMRVLDVEVSAREKAIETLRRLAAQYGLTKVASDAHTAAEAAAALATSGHSEEADELNKFLQAYLKFLDQIPDLQRQAAASAPAGRAAIAAVAAEADFDKKLADQLRVLQTPREERVAVRLRNQAPGGETTPDQDRLLAQIAAQERLNHAARLFEEVGGAVGQAWTSALFSIADGTKTVASAFRQMAQSILQSMAQIAAQEAFKGLIRLGVGLIVGGGVGAAGGGGEGAGGTVMGSSSGWYMRAQGGAVVNKPTLLMAGENPATNPETVLNRQQMQALMASAVRSAPSAGGQAAGAVTIINYTSDQRARAEAEASRQQAQGRRAILNEILQDMSQGEGSQIVRMMRTVQR